MYSCVENNSYMNASMSFGEIHVAPRRTSISEASRSLGCTACSASTFGIKTIFSFAAACAVLSFSRTLPERYSSAVCHVWDSGSR